jgi:hypothetical protein
MGESARLDRMPLLQCNRAACFGESDEFRIVQRRPAQAAGRREAKEAFERDLPALLPEYEGQWVAYYRSQRIGFGSSMPDLYQQCYQRGYRDKRILVRLVEEPLEGPTEVAFDG